MFSLILQHIIYSPLLMESLVSIKFFKRLPKVMKKLKNIAA